ncbi:hypothetical protein FHS76_000488 [Ochrobactrum daejeonense]|uniref:Uncharacterized protein n=1 Tax=Brucella daejeonensis TaxID=659015 RepID=A0A7W9AU56_9HYPH|nr:hypothetical protein [Brucella daejeonensis]MBB5700645.1 hypothetical protein [Brucella daejeonensis]
MDHTIEKVVRHWGFGDAPNGYIPRKLDDLINELMQARLEIPQEYWGDAYIEVDEYDGTPKLIVAYDRPETPEETVARKASEREHWEGQIKEAHKRVAYCEAHLAIISDSPIAAVQEGGDNRRAA